MTTTEVEEIVDIARMDLDLEDIKEAKDEWKHDEGLDEKEQHQEPKKPIKKKQPKA